MELLFDINQAVIVIGGITTICTALIAVIFRMVAGKLKDLDGKLDSLNESNQRDHREVFGCVKGIQSQIEGIEEDITEIKGKLNDHDRNFQVIWKNGRQQ